MPCAQVQLGVYSEEACIGQCGHAMASLKKAMTWDEELYGLECDLDMYNIVAVSDFNMGAMENKGLNVFNTSCTLASPQTATDADYERVEAPSSMLTPTPTPTPTAMPRMVARGSLATSTFTTGPGTASPCRTGSNSPSRKGSQCSGIRCSVGT